jgi:hypothetical protein
MGILVLRQLSQKASEPDRVEFSRSPASLGQAHERRFLKQFGHIHRAVLPEKNPRHGDGLQYQEESDSKSPLTWSLFS